MMTAVSPVQVMPLQFSAARKGWIPVRHAESSETLEQTRTAILAQIEPDEVAVSLPGTTAEDLEAIASEIESFDVEMRGGAIKHRMLESPLALVLRLDTENDTFILRAFRTRDVSTLTSKMLQDKITRVLYDYLSNQGLENDVLMVKRQ